MKRDRFGISARLLSAVIGVVMLGAGCNGTGATPGAVGAYNGDNGGADMPPDMGGLTAPDNGTIESQVSDLTGQQGTDEGNEATDAANIQGLEDQVAALQQAIANLQNGTEVIPAPMREKVLVPLEVRNRGYFSRQQFSDEWNIEARWIVDNGRLSANVVCEGKTDELFFYCDEGFAWDESTLVEQPAHTALGDLNAASVTAAAALTRRTPDIQALKSFNEAAFKRGVEQVRERILDGMVYQANLSERFAFEPGGIDPLHIFLGLLENNPSPFMGLLEHDGWALVCGSPERLFQHKDGTLRARPIAGTRPRGGSEAGDSEQRQLLLTDPKELAEHSMLVDLLRNDLAAVCETGSTHVSEAFSIERYSHVMHLVSEIQGQSKLGLLDVFASLFPGGSITGAPKIAAMQTIADFESSVRGPYTGSLGYVSEGYGTDFNILIRSLHMTAHEGVLSAGAGVVIDSDPTREYEEIERKAEGLKHVLGRGKKGLQPEVPQAGTKWLPPRPHTTVDANALFVENNDSFSHNIVDYLRSLGAKVTVLYPNVPAAKSAPNPVPNPAPGGHHGFSHIVIGPGPGTPQDWPNTLYWIDQAVRTRTPLLGICLGHQALGQHFGATLTRGPHPVHGEAQLMEHTGSALFSGLESPTPLARYHSLVLCSLPNELECTARTKDGLIMAIRHKTLPAFGVQFHPESFLSTGGLLILANFLHIVDASNTNLIV